MKVIDLLTVLRYDDGVKPEVRHDRYMLAQGISNPYTDGYDLVAKPEYEAFDEHIYDMEVKAVLTMEDLETGQIKIHVEV